MTGAPEGATTLSTDSSPGVTVAAFAADAERARSARRLASPATKSALDRLTGLTARLLAVPSARVSLLSDVQTIPGATGLDPGAREGATPLADSLCSVTAASGAPLVVADCAADERVAGLPPVRSGAVGAYLGVPLRGTDGHVVGTLCAFGPAPRSWSGADVSVLGTLAAAAVAELEVRALAVELDAERRRALAQREAAREQAEAARAATTAAAARLRLLASVGSDLNGTLDVPEAVARLGQHLVPAMADWCLVTLVDEHGGLRDVGHHHADPAALPLVRAYRDARLRALAPGSHLYEVWRTARPVTVAAGATAALSRFLDGGGPARDLIRRLAPEAFECLPLRARGRTVGLISLFHGAVGGGLGAEDLLLATELADRAGLALDNARLYSAQHRIAEGMQRSLLTAPVEPDHLQVVVRYRPAARAAQVGGDWYDAFLTPDGATVLVIGDVMGHDTAAAAEMSQVRTLLRGIAYTTGGSPATVLSGLDAAMLGLGVETTATAVVARLEQDEDERPRGSTRLRWANAGHLAPVLLTPDGTVTPLAALPPQLLLGIDPGTHRADAAIAVDRGSTILMFTDGLVERRDRPLDEGLRELQRAVAELSGETLDDLVDGVLARMVPSGHDDDVALVAVRLHRLDEPRPPEAGPRRGPVAVPPVAG